MIIKTKYSKIFVIQLKLQLEIQSLKRIYQKTGSTENQCKHHVNKVEREEKIKPDEAEEMK